MPSAETNARKKNVFPIYKSYLYFTLNVLSGLGIWNPSMEKGCKYWLYQAYTLYYILVIMFLRIITVWVRALNTTNSTEFSQEFSLLVVLICDAAKDLTFLFHRSDVLKILGIFNCTEWYNSDRQFRNNLSIFLALVKKPLAISIGGVVDLSAITFKNILTKHIHSWLYLRTLVVNEK